MTWSLRETLRRRLFKGIPHVCSRVDGYTEEELLHHAHDHLASAKVLFNASPSCYDSAGSLAHVGVELVFKALLLSSTEQFPAIHDLRRLRGLALREYPNLQLSKKERLLLNRVNRFFPMRYPEPQGLEPIGTNELGPILAVVQKLLAQLPEELQTEFRASLQKGGRSLMRFPKHDPPPA